MLLLAVALIAVKLRGVKVKEYVGKKVLWVPEHSKTRLWLEHIRSARVVELSPSGTYVRLAEGSYDNWYLASSIHVLEVLDTKLDE
jgi:hypothetical protein